MSEAIVCYDFPGAGKQRYARKKSAISEGFIYLVDCLGMCRKSDCRRNKSSVSLSQVMIASGPESNDVKGKECTKRRKASELSYTWWNV